MRESAHNISTTQLHTLAAGIDVPESFLRALGQHIWGEAAVPRDGRVYYYKVGTGEAAWTLPATCTLSGNCPCPPGRTHLL